MTYFDGSAVGYSRPWTGAAGPNPIVQTAQKSPSDGEKQPIRLQNCDNAPMSLRLSSLLPRPIGFAHRGARAHAPENTVEAFDLALRLGATALESDVWVTADKHLILDHGGRIGVRRRHIGTMERSELPDKLISLPELHARVPPTTDFSLDVKDDATMIPVLEWVSTLDIEARGRIWLCHHDWEQLAEWRSIDEHVRLVDSTSLDDMERGPERRAHQLTEAGIDAINLRRQEWTTGHVTMFHKFERVCFGWDAQHARVLQELLRMGIDGVYSDHSDVMTEVIADHLDQRPATDSSPTTEN